MRKYRHLVYGLLGLCWLGTVAWQVAEHRRVRATVSAGQLDRAHDIATSLAVVIRSQRRFGTVPRNRLVDALEALAKSRELLGIALLNPQGETVAAGGLSVPGDVANLTPGATVRAHGRLIVASLVELGQEPLPRGDGRDPRGGPGSSIPPSSAVVWNPEEPTGEGPRHSGPPPANALPSGSIPPSSLGAGPAPQAPAPLPPHPAAAPSPALTPTLADSTPPGPTPDAASATAPPASATPASLGPPPQPGDDSEAARAARRAFWDRLRRNRPPWDDPQKMQALYETQGLHMMVLMLDDTLAAGVLYRDLLARLALVVIALAAVLGFGLAWRSVNRSTQLQIRLARARAMNSYLRELNLAAAGLAHETRNPLNLVRGLAQTVARAADTPPPARQQLNLVLEEVDRITARLNEFIDYSKPREPQLAAVDPAALAHDVARALQTDLEDKHLRFTCATTDQHVLADATMLRQVLFNLLLNAVQATPAAGEVSVVLELHHLTADLLVLDTGPGVPEAARNDIFRPYFTLTEHGSGLGLAVVRQIALAHNWEISYAPRPTGGSCFRLSGLTLTGKGTA